MITLIKTRRSILKFKREDVNNEPINSIYKPLCMLHRQTINNSGTLLL